jgi:uncharacterized protein YfaS (alpha-2-macroglobulin family)
VLQAGCTVTDPSGKATELHTTSSSNTGSLSIRVPGSLNSILGSYTLSCKTAPNPEDQVHLTSIACIWGVHNAC